MATIPVPFVTPARYLAMVGGVQAVGLVVGLTVAVLSLLSGNDANRVDRVLDLHRELVSGDVGNARSRLADHLRRVGQAQLGSHYVYQPEKGDLRRNPQANAYEDAAAGDARPATDRALLLRYFERADGALKEGILHHGLFHRLIGSHVLWWDAALINEDLDRPHRHSLALLAEWVVSYTGADVIAYTRYWATSFSTTSPDLDFVTLPAWTFKMFG